MPRPSCLPCCNPTEMSRSTETYRASVLQILCAQMNVSVVSGFCDEAGNPIIVRTVFDANGENPTVTAWNMDGSPYEGVISNCGA